MSDPNIPEPAVMPLDREAWYSALHLSNFVNTYYQYRDLMQCAPNKSVLIVGPGQGLTTAVLRWKQHEVVTLDIDRTFEPDVVGSVHDMSMFADQQFDAVIASHVIEHVAVPLLDQALREIARVGRHAVVYVPIAGRHVQLRLQTLGLGDVDAPLTLDVFNYWHRPDGLTARYMSGQHFWELGHRGFRLSDLKKRLSRHFEIVSAYRNRDWILSQNFVLRSRWQK